MTEKIRDCGVRLWSAVAHADRAAIANTARRSMVVRAPQVRPLVEQQDRVAKLVKKAAVTAQLCSPATEPSHRVTGAAASFLPTPPLQVADIRAEEHLTTTSTLPAAPHSEQQQQQQVWERFALSRRAVAMGAFLGVGGAAFVLWSASGGLLAVPTVLHLAGFGAAGAKAGTVAAAVQTTLAPSLAAGGACATACGTAAGGAAGAVPMLMSNAMLSAAGGSLVGGAGAASMALMYVRGLLGVQGPREGEGEGGGQAQQVGEEARPV